MRVCVSVTERESHRVSIRVRVRVTVLVWVFLPFSFVLRLFFSLRYDVHEVVEIFQVIVVNVKGEDAGIYFVVRLAWLHNFAVFISTEKYRHMIIEGSIIAGHEEFRGAMSVRVD
jgi:hypothetical protein